jgi:hypothetical protein
MRSMRSANFSAAGCEPVNSRPLAVSFSFPPYLVASLLPFAHTRSIASLRHFFSPTKSAEDFLPGGIAAHGLSGFEPAPFGLTTEVTVNFTIPGILFRNKS